MAVREFNFTVGPETSELPAIGVPSSPDDLISQGYADIRYTQGSEAVADNATLKAMAEAERRDGDLVLVKDANNLYRFDSAASDTDDGNFFLAPDAGTGRWVRVTILNRAVNFTDTTESTDKDTGAMILEGGLGVEKNVNVGGSVVVTGDLTVSGTTTTIDVDDLQVEDPNILVNRGGNQSTADTAVAGVTVSISDATDYRLGYDSTLASKFKAGEVGSESEVITAAGDQVMTGKKSFNSSSGTDFDKISAPATPAASTGRLYFSSTDGTFHQIDDGGVDQSLVGGSGGSGTGEINYIFNPDAEANTDGYVLYKDAAQSEPEDGTGGSSGLAFNRQTGVILRDLASFQIVKDAVNRQGEGVRTNFTIKEQDTSKKLKIQFDFKTDEDAAYETGDFGVYIYDITNSTLITPSDVDLVRGTNIFQTSFNSTTSLSYRLIFHCATTNASAYDIYLDNIIVGPGMTSQGAAIGAWEEFTVNSNNINVSAEKGFYRRVGDSIDMSVSIGLGGAVTGTMFVDLPDGLTFDFSKMAGDAGDGGAWSRIGSAQGNDGGSAYHVGVALVASSDTNTIYVAGDDGSNLWAATVPFTWASGDQFTLQIKAPISEWAGKGIVPMLAEDNLSEWQDFTPSFTNFTPNSIFNSKFKRSGDSLLLQVSVNHSGPGAGGDVEMTLPNSLTLNVTSNPSLVGKGYVNLSGSTKGITVRTEGTNKIRFIKDGEAIDNIDGVEFASGDDLAFWVEVPVEEYVGSQNSLVGYSIATETQAGLMPSYASGTYTPSLTGTINVDSVSLNKAFYTKIGDFVTIFLSVSLDATSATATTEATLNSLPIARTDGNFSNNLQAIGSGANGISDSMRVSANSGAQTLTLRTYPLDASGNDYAITVTYALKNI